jgi:hypothetical protein
LRCGPGDPRETKLSSPVAASAAVNASVHEGKGDRWLSLVGVSVAMVFGVDLEEHGNKQ